MSFSRRQFLKRAGAVGAALLVPAALDATFARMARGALATAAGYGPLVADPAGLLDLPAGFSYRTFSTATLDATDDPRFSQRLDGGDPVPALHDGMGSFAGPRGVTILVRNHELDPGNGPAVDPGARRRYDPLGTGGTTTLWIDRDGTLLRSFASLSGTFRNCAGGVTPWGSWLSAEECTYMPGPDDPVNHDRRSDVTKPHGYVFEVDSRATELVDPVPIRGMGRFYHEAIAVDPVTGFVYLTEDREDGLLYRFTPDVVTRGRKHPGQMRVGDLHRGGSLEALRVPNRHGLLTQNWGPAESRVAVGAQFPIDWVEVPDIEPESDMEVEEVAATTRDHASAASPPAGRKRRVRTAAGSTRAQGFRLGCAQFARAEGICYDDGSIYACCTDGGPARDGQVWRLDLRRNRLTLALESADRAILDGPDNICVAPSGDLIVCEDGRDSDRVIGITRDGRVYEIARNAYNDSEMAGACFSPDGRTLFVNAQQPGVTYAIRGPWDRRG
jgi:secreted PhoX family phosphatase